MPTRSPTFRSPPPPALRSALRVGRPAIIALALVSLLASRADALDPSRTLTQSLLRKWQVQQGLPQATIFAIRQTADGYLWLGTQTGLFRFDGVRFSGVRGSQHAPLENSWVQALCEDAAHDLWIGADGAGLLRLADGRAAQYRQADGLPSDNVRCLVFDQRGNLWIGAEGGLARFAQGRLSAVSLSDGAPRDVRAVCEAPDGTIWIGGDGNTLAAFDGAEFHSRALDSVDASAAVGALLAARDGALWVGTTAGLVRLEHDQERCFTRADGLADDAVNCLAEGRDGSLWVGTKDGFSRVLNGEIESFRAQEGLSQSTVYTLCEDHEGSLWVGTKHGLNQFVDRRTIPFTASEGLPSNDTGPVFQDRAGTVWVGTLDAGLARFDGRQFSAAATSGLGLAGDRVLSLADGDEGDVWVGTDRGVSRLRGGRVAETFSIEQGLPSNVVRSLCRDHRGVVWAGTSAGLAELRDGRFAAPDAVDPELSVPVLALIAARGEFLLAAMEGAGVFRVQGGHFRPLDGEAGALPDAVALYQDDDGLLWIGSRGGGLYLVDGDRTHRFTVKDGLYDDEIFGIVADGDDRLWMACSKGIFFVSRGELRKFAAGGSPGVSSTPFSPTDALRTIECQEGVQPGIWKMRDGRIWFSTVRGLIVIDPRRLQRSLPPPPVVVEELKVNGQRLRPAEIDQLPPGRTNLDFRYTALSFASPTRTEFRYRLDGFDKKWVEAGPRREAFYTNLPPGDYRFRAAARTAAGEWSEAPNPLAFRLEPHFYQTRWFLPLLALLLGLAGWGAYRIRVRRIKIELRAVLAERSRIARELHDTLIQGFSGVTMEMQALAARLAPSQQRSTLAEIIRDAGACLREARRSVAGLRSAGGEAGLAAALDRSARQIAETHDVRLKLCLDPAPPELPADVQYNLLRIAQEAVSNAVKHAAARTIEVELTCSPRELRLSVKDDGEGFDASDVERASFGHYGLIGMRERAAQIGAAFRLESGPQQGTTVCLALPVPSSGDPEASAAAAPPPPGALPATQRSDR